MREAVINRATTETKISLTLKLDGTGKYCCDTGVAFLDHMLEQFTRHGRFDLSVQCTGDIGVDAHHTTEDVGIALGAAFATALGDKAGITRYGSCVLPMDEALVLSVIDISGRSHLSFDLDLPAATVGTFDTELVREFFEGFARALGATIHLRQLAGANTHHIIEAAFKGFGRAMSTAVAPDARSGGEIPSTKGIL